MTNGELIKALQSLYGTVRPDEPVEIRFDGKNKYQLETANLFHVGGRLIISAYDGQLPVLNPEGEKPDDGEDGSGPTLGDIA